MIKTRTPSGTEEMKTRLTTLWIFAMFNYLYCDVIALMNPSLLRQFMAGNLGFVQISQGFLLGSAILMEIPISMVILSRVLNNPSNRLANILAGALMTVVQFASLFFGSAPTPYYVFFSVVEIGCTVLITWFAWKWSTSERNLINKTLPTER